MIVSIEPKCRKGSTRKKSPSITKNSSKARKNKRASSSKEEDCSALIT